MEFFGVNCVGDVGVGCWEQNGIGVCASSADGSANKWGLENGPRVKDTEWVVYEGGKKGEDSRSHRRWGG